MATEKRDWITITNDFVKGAADAVAAATQGGKIAYVIVGEFEPNDLASAAEAVKSAKEAISGYGEVKFAKGFVASPVELDFGD